MKTIIGFLFISFFLSVSMGAYPSSFTTLSNFDSAALLNMLEDAIDHIGKNIENLIAYYHDFMASSKIVYFFKSYFPHDLNPGTTVLLFFGFAGLWGYGRKWTKK
jgi:hypothetical protein